MCVNRSQGAGWLEAWVRDLPNLVITPRSACYSDQAFTEQRSRGAAVIERFLKVRIGVAPAYIMHHPACSIDASYIYRAYHASCIVHHVHL